MIKPAGEVVKWSHDGVMGKPPHKKMVILPDGLPSPDVLDYAQIEVSSQAQKEGAMELLTFTTGMLVRIALPLVVLFWISARLRAWDQGRLA